MSGVNKVILIGHLGADPELRYTGTGQGVCEFRLATTESWKDKSGAKQERTEWHRIVVWGKVGESCAKYLTKGRQAFIEGRIQTRSWDDKDGTKRYMTEIVASEVQFLGGGKDGGRGRDDGPPPPDDPGDEGRGFGAGGGFGGQRPDDDLPFGSCSIGDEPSAIAPVLRGTP